MSRKVFQMYGGFYRNICGCGKCTSEQFRHADSDSSDAFISKIHSKVRDGIQELRGDREGFLARVTLVIEPVDGLGPRDLAGLLLGVDQIELLGPDPEKDLAAVLGRKMAEKSEGGGE